MTVLDRDLTAETTDGAERDRLKHYVKKDDILKAMFDGTPAIALCGKKWIPNRDPQKYPICKTCEKIFKSLPPGGH